jgi:hypothetical protein
MMLFHYSLVTKARASRYRNTARLDWNVVVVVVRATRSRECALDDRLRDEAVRDRRRIASCLLSSGSGLRRWSDRNDDEPPSRFTCSPFRPSQHPRARAGIDSRRVNGVERPSNPFHHPSWDDDLALATYIEMNCSSLLYNRMRITHALPNVWPRATADLARLSGITLDSSAAVAILFHSFCAFIVAIPSSDEPLRSDRLKTGTLGHSIGQPC